MLVYTHVQFSEHLNSKVILAIMEGKLKNSDVTN